MERIIRNGIFSLVAVLLTACATSNTPESIPPPKGAVVKVSSSEGYHGTGFAISDTLIVTNKHVIGESPKINIKSLDGQTQEGFVVYENIERDIIVISVKKKIPNYLEINCNPPSYGEVVYYIGFPLGVEWGIFYGRAVQIEDEEFYLDAAINSGSSGSPVLNTRNQVIGIVQTATVQLIAVPQLGIMVHTLGNFGGAISSPVICKVLEKASLHL